MYRPLVDETLFDYFIRQAKSEDGVLEFVKNYGPLTHDGLRKGKEVSRIIHEGEEMSEVLRDRMVAGPLNPLNVSIVSDDQGARLKISPKCLLDALWLQLAQANVRMRNAAKCSLQASRVIEGATLSSVLTNAASSSTHCSAA